MVTFDVEVTQRFQGSVISDADVTNARSFLEAAIIDNYDSSFWVVQTLDLSEG